MGQPWAFKKNAMNACNITLNAHEVKLKAHMVVYRA